MVHAAIEGELEGDAFTSRSGLRAGRPGQRCGRPHRGPPAAGDVDDAAAYDRHTAQRIDNMCVENYRQFADALGAGRSAAAGPRVA